MTNETKRRGIHGELPWCVFNYGVAAVIRDRHGHALFCTPLDHECPDGYEYEYERLCRIANSLPPEDLWRHPYTLVATAALYLRTIGMIRTE